jgi:hypothetical protein
MNFDDIRRIRGGKNKKMQKNSNHNRMNRARWTEGDSDEFRRFPEISNQFQSLFGKSREAKWYLQAATGCAGAPGEKATRDGPSPLLPARAKVKSARFKANQG